MVQKRTFSKEFLQETIWGGTDAKVIENNLVDQRRWVVTYSMVFEYEGKYYEIAYDKGATELQDQAPFEYEPDLIEVVEVEKVEVVTYEWRPVGEKSDATDSADEG